MEWQSVIDRLKAYKEEHHLSLKALAGQLDRPESTVRHWMSTADHARVPEAKTQKWLDEWLSSREQANGGVLEMFPATDRPSQNADAQPLDPDEPEKTRPIAEYPFTTISRPQSHKVVTDAIHGDIELTRLETAVMDTVEFQRLHTFRQLASAYLVYPSATHTRFEHSLGTLAMAQSIIDGVNTNTASELTVGAEPTLLIRLAALLHDITYVPFGHELEDEARLVGKHETRYGEFLAADKPIGKLIREAMGSQFLDDLNAVLNAHGEEAISTLRHPYASDIVFNTVCADLLDYLQRDNYFTGLRESFGHRFMRFFAIQSVASGSPQVSPRLVIRVERRGTLRRDVLSEIVHLLRARYTLGEKVYFHKTKQIASGMLSKAVQLAGLHVADDLMMMGDERLLWEIEQSGQPAAERLVGELRARSLFKACYRVGRDVAVAHFRLDHLARLHESPEDRSALEAELASDVGLSAADVIIYCPNADMALKQALVKVVWPDGVVRSLSSITDDPVQSEIVELHRKHQSLWKLHVLLRGSLVHAKGQELSDACVHRWGIPNEIPEFSRIGPAPARRALEELGVQEELRVEEMLQLEAVALSGDVPRTVDEWRSLMYSVWPDRRK